MDFDPDLSGDSDLGILPPAVQLSVAATQIRIRASVDGEQFMFDGFANERGFLSRLVGELSAADFRDAALKAQKAMAPSLSNWSAHLDIPIHVERTLVQHIETGDAELHAPTPFRAAAFAVVDQTSLTPEFRAFASLYREALNSNSVAYQFLCLFKIVEGIYHRRARLGQQSRSRGVRPSRPPENIPESVDENAVRWLRAIFLPPHEWDSMALDTIFIEEARGRKIKDVADNELRDIRDDIGHVLSRSLEKYGWLWMNQLTSTGFVSGCRSFGAALGGS